MPRFYFHIRSGAIEIPDEKGQEFGCVSDAHDHAQQIIRRSLLYLKGAELEERWNVRIANEEDENEVIVLFPIRQRFRDWNCPQPAEIDRVSAGRAPGAQASRRGTPRK